MELKSKESEKTHLTAAANIPATSTSTEFVTVGEAIERVGCGFGTILYALGPYGVMITCGAEVSVMAIVSLMVRCEWEMSTFSMSVLQITGMVFSSIFSICFSNLGDTLGRRPVLIVTTLVAMLAGLLSGMCTQLWQLLVCRAVIGASTGIGFGPAMAYATEIPTIKYRALSMASNGLGWGIGTAFSSILAYLTLVPLGWRGFLIALALSCSPFLIIVILTRESPRYDLQVGKVSEAMETIEILSKLNCTGDKTENLSITEDPHVEQEISTFCQSYQVIQESGYAHEFWILVCVNFTSEFAYMCIIYAAPRFMNEGYCSSSTYTREESCIFDKAVLFDLGIIGLAEPFSILLALLFVNWIGRIKLTIFTSVFPTLLLFLLYICVGTDFILAVLLITKGALTVRSWLIFVIAGESFPTSVRSFTNCILGGCCSISSIAASFAVHYAYEENPIFVIVVMQGVLVITSVFAFCIKRETSGTLLE